MMDNKGERAIHFFVAAYSTASFRITFFRVFLPSARWSLVNRPGEIHGDFRMGRRQLRCRHDCLASRDCRQNTLALKLASLEQQSRRDTFLASQQRHTHARLIGTAH